MSPTTRIRRPADGHSPSNRQAASIDMGLALYVSSISVICPRFRTWQRPSTGVNCEKPSAICSVESPISRAIATVASAPGQVMPSGRLDSERPPSTRNRSCGPTASTELA